MWSKTVISLKAWNICFILLCLNLSIQSYHIVFLFRPTVAAVLAGADRFVLQLVYSGTDCGGSTCVFLFPEQLEYQAWEEHEDPQAQVHDPPPPADSEPPEAAMAFFPIF